MILEKPTSKEIWDKYKDKNSYEWLSSGVHVYNVLKREEENEKIKIEKQKNERGRRFKK